jgi:hypothetical protein
MLWLGGDAGGVHAEDVNSGVGEDFAAEAGEVAIYGADQLGGLVAGEETEVPVRK